MATRLADIFRNRVRDLLDQRNLTQSDLAKLMGVHKQYVSHLMTGVRNPGFDSLEKAAEALGVDPAELISEKIKV